jgi:hypothetical protein
VLLRCPRRVWGSPCRTLRTSPRLLRVRWGVVLFVRTSGASSSFVLGRFLLPVPRIERVSSAPAAGPRAAPPPLHPAHVLALAENCSTGEPVPDTTVPSVAYRAPRPVAVIVAPLPTGSGAARKPVIAVWRSALVRPLSARVPRYGGRFHVPVAFSQDRGVAHRRVGRSRGALDSRHVASWKLVQACGWKSRPGKHWSAR